MAEASALKVDIPVFWFVDSSLKNFKLGKFEAMYCPKFICLGVWSAKSEINGKKTT